MKTFPPPAGAIEGDDVIIRLKDNNRTKYYKHTSNGKPMLCGKGLESEGGSVVPRGSWDWGPLWWECEDDGEQWGFA